MADDEFVPYVPADKSMPELTIKAIILGALLSVILGMANEYAGLYVGMTVCASIPAAVISMAIFRILKGNILENNMVQTGASAGEALAAGVIFTVAALLFTSSSFTEPVIPGDLPYLEWTILIIVGGLFGVFLTIFLRYALVVEEKLPYPEGIACAETLKAGHKGGKSFKYLMSGLGIGAIIRAFTGDGSVQAFSQNNPMIAKFPPAEWGGKKLSGGIFGDYACEPLMMAVGYIIGFKTAAWMFAGTVLAFWVLTPAVAMLTVESAALDVATFEAVRGDFVKPIAIGAMLVGGIWTLISMRGAIATSLKRARGARGVELEKMPRTERDLPLKLAFIVISTLCIPTFAIYWYLSKSAGFGIMALVLALIFGFIFSSVSAYIVGLVGSSNNPASGMTLATLFVSCAVLAGLGVTGDTGMILAIGIIAIACCALAIGGDQMQDLKAGYMLGATPRNQQIMQLIGVVAMALVAVPLLNMLASAYGIGPGPDGTGGLEAPQAFMMRSTASAFFETGTPWLLYAIGGALAFMLILFGLPVLPIAIGLYLSFWMIAGIFVGGIVRWITDRMMMRRSDEERDAATNNGVIASSGLVAGSALMGIVIAFVIVLSRKNLNEWAGTAVGAATWPIYVIMALVALFIIYIATHEFIGKGKKA